MSLKRSQDILDNCQTARKERQGTSHLLHVWAHTIRPRRLSVPLTRERNLGAVFEPLSRDV